MFSSTAITTLLSLLPLLASASPVVTRNNDKKLTGLNGLAARTNRYVGTATNSFNLQGTSPVGPYNEVLEYEFAGALTAENEGKWEVIHPEQNVYNFTGMDIVSPEHDCDFCFTRQYTDVFLLHSLILTLNIPIATRRSPDTIADCRQCQAHRSPSPRTHLCLAPTGMSISLDR